MDVTIYERCETMASGLPEDYLVGLTKPSVDRILKMENPGDCLALYTFYCYTRKWQQNSSVFATSEYAMNGLGWGRDRFSHAKKQLKNAGFIDDVVRKGEGGRVEKWYVEVRFAQSATLGVFHTTENLHCGKTSDKYLGIVNEIPSNGMEMQIGVENSAEASSSTNDFFNTNESQRATAQASEAKASDSKPPRSMKTQGLRKSSVPPPKPDGITEQTWEAFCDIRKEKKAKITPAVLNIIQSEAQKAGWPLEDALRECVLRGWRGFKAEWVSNQKKPQQTNQSFEEIDWSTVKPNL